MHFNFVKVHVCLMSFEVHYMFSPFRMPWLSTKLHGVRFESLFVSRVKVNMLLEVLMRIFRITFPVGEGYLGACSRNAGSRSFGSATSIVFQMCYHGWKCSNEVLPALKKD